MKKHIIIIFFLFSLFGQANAEEITKNNNIVETNEVKLYIENHLQLYDVDANMFKTYEGKKPGVKFKIKNNGNQTIERIEVTVFFKDDSNNFIHEEKFYPINNSLWNETSVLKPGYIWQIERGLFFHAPNVPSEWKIGSVICKITDIKLKK